MPEFHSKSVWAVGGLSFNLRGNVDGNRLQFPIGTSFVAVLGATIVRFIYHPIGG